MGHRSSAGQRKVSVELGQGIANDPRSCRVFLSQDSQRGL